MTVFLTGVYFVDMLRLSKDASLEGRSEQLWIGLLNGFSFFIITLAAISLIIHAFIGSEIFVFRILDIVGCKFYYVCSHRLFSSTNINRLS